MLDTLRNICYGVVIVGTGICLGVGLYLGSRFSKLAYDLNNLADRMDGRRPRLTRGQGQVEEFLRLLDKLAD